MSFKLHKIDNVIDMKVKIKDIMGSCSAVAIADYKTFIVCVITAVTDQRLLFPLCLKT